MKDLHKILQDITQLTLKIETDYPELYRSLDENPLTLPVDSHPEIDKNVMQVYLKSLKEVLEHYVEEQKIEQDNRN
ncbi:hypothetical protein MWU59_08835 [Flavobacteriaceae bacterium F08102]|nr:hypothetical protein [Flavobacteriaceae bacterium F08102]